MSTRDTTSSSDGIDSVSRYDLVLIVIPASFILALVAGHVLPVSPRVALTAGSIVGAIAVFDGLFRNPPGPGARSA